MIEKLIEERTRYCEFFAKGISQLKSGNLKSASELLICTNEENTDHPFNLIRIDFIFKVEEENDKIFALQTDSREQYDTILGSLNHSIIEVSPFCWESCDIIANKIDLNKLISWIEKWIDLDDARFLEFSNSIHSCTMINRIDNKDEITIDFGTSPVEAFLELLEFLTEDNEKIIIK